MEKLQASMNEAGVIQPHTYQTASYDIEEARRMVEVRRKHLKEARHDNERKGWAGALRAAVRHLARLVEGKAK